MLPNCNANCICHRRWISTGGLYIVDGVCDCISDRLAYSSLYFQTCPKVYFHDQMAYSFDNIIEILGQVILRFGKDLNRECVAAKEHLRSHVQRSKYRAVCNDWASECLRC